MPNTTAYTSPISNDAEIVPLITSFTSLELRLRSVELLSFEKKCFLPTLDMSAIT